MTRGLRRTGALVAVLLSASASAQTTPPPDNAPDMPDRGTIVSAITAVRPAIVACAAGRRGQVVLGLRFASSGSLASVRVVSGTLDGAPIANTPVEQCILTAAARARVPPFRHADFTVNYPLTFTGQ